MSPIEHIHFLKYDCSPLDSHFSKIYLYFECSIALCEHFLQHLQAEKKTVVSVLIQCAQQIITTAVELL